MATNPREGDFKCTDTTEEGKGVDDDIERVVALKADLKLMTRTDPTLAREFINMLNSETPDLTDPVTKESHPLFFNSSKNTETFTYQPKEGFGFQKDGGKYHGFTYQCNSNTRSKDLFGADIQKAIADGIESTMSKEATAAATEYDYSHICALASTLVAAFSDLVLNGNDDMTSYLYLCNNALHALSPVVKEELKIVSDDLSKDGGVALGLVTELIATCANAENLFKKAVQPRQSSRRLSGIQALNEANIQKLFTAITPAVQTKGLLLNSGIDVSKPWAKDLITRAPNLDNLVGMEYESLLQCFNTSTSTTLSAHSNPPDAPVPDAPVTTAGEQQIVRKMYAGLLGTPSHTDIPPLRRQLMNAGDGSRDMIALATALEEEFKVKDLLELNDKKIINIASKLAQYETIGTSETDQPASSSQSTSSRSSQLNRALTSTQPAGATEDKISVYREIEKYLTIGLQGTLEENAAPSFNLNAQLGGDGGPNVEASIPLGTLVEGGMQVAETLGQSFFGKGATVTGGGRLATSLLGSVGGTAASSGLAASLLGTGASAAAGSSTLAALGGPVGVALALAPLLIDGAAETEKRMAEDLTQTKSDRDKISSEVSDLLSSIENLSTAENAEKQKALAEDLLDKVRSPNALTFLKFQGMGLQNELNALETRFSPTNMAALPPYQSDSELVAAVDSGKALSAIALYINANEVVTTPQRQLLATPRYVNMMGPSQPFYTKTTRTTSEKQMQSFITSTSHSGFSTADQTVTDASFNGQGSLNVGFAGWKGSGSMSEQTKEEKKQSYANDQEHKEKETKSVSQAIVTEFTFMPMRTISLRVGGLVLTDYVYYRIQRICQSGADWRERAREVLRNFGSHVPFGIQTLGGVYIRTMKIETVKEEKLTEMYSAASSELTKSNARAAKGTTENTARVGLFGLGGSMSTSAGFSSARSSGSSSIEAMADGTQENKRTMDCRFESDVICFGPNAATQDSLHAQLMSNNATWTVIDRGEPGSYLALWDLLDYLGQGQILKKEAKILREVWEEMALANSGYGKDGLLSIVMRDYPTKRKMFDFVQAMIYCMVPNNDGWFFNGDLATQFENVVTHGVEHMNEGTPISSPEEFVALYFDSLSEEEAPMFTLVGGNGGYTRVEDMLLATRTNEWDSDFCYYSDTNSATINEKGKPFYLFSVAAICCNSNPDDNDWNLFENLFDSMASPPLSEFKKKNLERALMYEDAKTGNHCMHLVLQSNNLELVRKVYMACPRVADISNQDNETPKEIKEKSSELTNLNAFNWESVNEIEGAAPIWAVDELDNVYYRKLDGIWHQFITKKMKYVSTSRNGEHVWAITSYGDVYYRSKDMIDFKSVGNKGGDHIRMNEVSVSADGKHIWAIAYDHKVYYRSNDRWERDDNSDTLTSISVSGDGSKLVGARPNTTEDILMRYGKDSPWTDGGAHNQNLVSISPNGNHTWIWKRAPYVGHHVYEKYEDGTWEKEASKRFNHICVDDYQVWAIDDSKSLWSKAVRSETWQPVHQPPTNIPLRQISVCASADISNPGALPFRGNSIWCIDSTRKRLFYQSRCSIEWEEFESPAAGTKIDYITTSTQGEVWVSIEGSLFYRAGQAFGWQFLRGNVGPISAADDGGLLWVERIDGNRDVLRHPDGSSTLIEEVRGGKIGLFPQPPPGEWIPKIPTSGVEIGKGNIVGAKIGFFPTIPPPEPIPQKIGIDDVRGGAEAAIGSAPVRAGRILQVSISGDCKYIACLCPNDSDTRDGMYVLKANNEWQSIRSSETAHISISNSGNLCNTVPSGGAYYNVESIVDQFEGDNGNTWRGMSDGHSFVDVSVSSDSNHMWGITNDDVANGTLYYRNGNNGSWQHVPTPGGIAMSMVEVS